MTMLYISGFIVSLYTIRYINNYCEFAKDERMPFMWAVLISLMGWISVFVLFALIFYKEIGPRISRNEKVRKFLNDFEGRK